MNDRFVVELADDAIAKVVKDVQPHWGPLGWVTYKRTYARYVDSQQRNENWDETVKRVVEGNINLDPRLRALRGKKNRSSEDIALIASLQEEAMRLFSLIYGLGATPSGRNLWVSGTTYQSEHGDALNNCSFYAPRVNLHSYHHRQSNQPWLLIHALGEWSN